MLWTIYYSEWTYFLLGFFASIKTTREFYRLITLSGASPFQPGGILINAMIYSLGFLCVKGWLDSDYLYVIMMLMILLYVIELYRKRVEPFANIAYTLLGIVYISVPFTCLHMVAFTQGSYQYPMVLGIVVLVWVHDIGAYIIGSHMGKHYLFHRISPQKSWEGSLGGAAVALLVGHIIACYSTSIAYTTWITITVIIVIAGTYGDLTVSMLKRSLDVKDSGNSIPGHGGYLDRLDSFLLAMPVILVFFKLLFKG